MKFEDLEDIGSEDIRSNLNIDLRRDVLLKLLSNLVFCGSCTASRVENKFQDEF